MKSTTTRYIEDYIVHPETANQAYELEGGNPFVFAKSYCEGCEILQKQIVSNGDKLADLLEKSGHRLVWIDMHEPEFRDRYREQLKGYKISMLPAFGIYSNGELHDVKAHPDYYGLLDACCDAYQQKEERTGIAGLLRKLWKG